MRQRSETLRASCTPDSRPMRAFRLLGRFQFLHPLLYPLILTLLSAPLTTPLRADTISGTVKDPSGAVVAGARIEISGSALAEPLVLTSDDTGKFVAANLSAGKYSVRVAKEGFDELLTTVDLHGTADLPLSLTITPQQTSVTVNEKSSAFANSDPVYRQLRNNGLGDTFRCENFTLPIDVGTFELKSGTITFLATVNKSQTRWCGAQAVRRPRKTLPKQYFVSLPINFHNSSRRWEPERIRRRRRPARFSIGKIKSATATRCPKA